MSLLVNGAGGSAADPILAGLRAKFVFAASTMDVASIVEAWLDQTSGAPGTNSVRASLSPAHTVLTAGVAGTYNDTTDQLTISSTTGLSAGDAIYLSHASITDGIYIIASVVNGTVLTLENDPFAGLGSQSTISYQVAWAFEESVGTAPIVASAGGQANYFKARVQDALTTQTDSEDIFYARTAPAGAAYIALNGGDYTGQTLADNTLTLSILPGWTNNGGISHVELANHSGQGVNNFTWTSGGGTAERTISLAESSGLTVAAGDGAKYGRLLFKTKAGGTALGVDISMTLDTSGPVLVFSAFGA